MVFLPFHPSVLKPDFDLALGQTESVRDLHPPSPGQVAVIMELLLELQDLLSRVGCPRAFGFTP